jgi:hypothetical protein
MATRCVTRSVAIPCHRLLAWTIVKIVLATGLLSRVGFLALSRVGTVGAQKCALRPA